MSPILIILAKSDRFSKVEILTRISLQIVPVKRTIGYPTKARGMEEQREFLLQAEYLAERECVVESFDTVHIKDKRYEMFVVW